jgi:hypothetical protein
VFLQKPSIRQEGDKIVLECKLTADPKPAVSWSLNGQAISFAPGSRLTPRILSQGSTHTLTLEIAKVSMTDAGEYKAYAKNEVGEATATITLNFEGEGGARKVARLNLRAFPSSCSSLPAVRFSSRVIHYPTCLFSSRVIHYPLCSFPSCHVTTVSVLRLVLGPPMYVLSSNIVVLGISLFPPRGFSNCSLHCSFPIVPSIGVFKLFPRLGFSNA